jgi:site-specific DNA recombinase
MHHNPAIRTWRLPFVRQRVARTGDGLVVTLRIAIYGRHSTDKQNPTSSADQADACQRVVDYLGGKIVETYLDPEISGYRRDRPGLQRMLRDVRDGRIDVVVCEALDRIARDAEDVAWIGKKLKFSQVRLHTVSENEIDDMKLAVASMLGSIFLSQLQQKTLRGMKAAALAGRFVGGKAYGYRKVNRIDERGQPMRGLLEIVPEEAEVVCRIFSEFASGRSARDIVKRLNEDGVPSPRGGLWNQSTVRGDPKKHVGVLNNPLYRGELIWGRREWRKNPDSEKRERRYRLRAEEEWVRIGVPDLRIVSDELALQASAELERRALPAGSRSAVGARRSRHLLSGLIKCGVCGANYVVGSKDYYRCASVKERGTCSNTTSVKISRIEDLALSTLQSELLTDASAELFAVEFNREVERLAKLQGSHETEAEERLRELEQQIENLAANMLAGVVSPTIARMLQEREDECEDLRRRLARNAVQAPTVLAHPMLRRRFEERIRSLRESLSDPDNRSAVANVLSELIEEIVIHPASAGVEPEAEVAASLSKLVSFANAESRPPVRDRLSKSAIKVVAGTGFEPVTFRL